MIPTHRAPTHPGEILLEEFLKPLEMTQAAAAKTLGISTVRLNELVRGKRGVTADTALRLAQLFKTTPQFWMHRRELRLKPTLHPPQWATKRLPVLRQTRTQQSRCAAGPEGGDVRGGRALAQEDLRRCHRKDSPDHDFVHGGDSLRPGRAWDARNLSQYLRSPRRRGHIQERASQQQIIGAGLVVRRAALVADEHVRGHVRR